MKKTLALLLMIAAIGSSCTKQDVDEMRETIERLRALSGINSIASQLEATGWAKEITAMPNEDGYIIEVDRDKISTLYIETTGKPGLVVIEPETAPDGKAYWKRSEYTNTSNKGKAIVRSEDDPQRNEMWLTDKDGNKMVDNGNLFQIRINHETKEWEVSSDGIIWINTNILATADPIFDLTENKEGMFKMTRDDGHVATIMKE